MWRPVEDLRGSPRPVLLWKPEGARSMELAATPTQAPVCMQHTRFSSRCLWFIPVTDLSLSSPRLTHIMSAGKEWLIVPDVYLFYLGSYINI